MYDIEKINWIKGFDVLSASFPSLNDSAIYHRENVQFILSSMRGIDFQEHSFVVKENGVPVICCPLFLSKEHRGFFHLPAPIFVNTSSTITIKKKNYSKLFDYLKGIGSLKIQSSHFSASIFFENIVSISPRALSYIELSEELELIQKSVRKSYRSLINWGKKNLETQVYDNDTINSEVVDIFTRYYEKVSGEKIDNEYAQSIHILINLGKAFLIFSRLDGELVGVSLTKYGTKDAIYSMGAYDRKLMLEGRPLSHWPIVLSVQALKEKGCEQLILGFKLFSTAMNSESEKEKSIFKFKKGFSQTVKIENTLNLSF